MKLILTVLLFKLCKIDIPPNHVKIIYDFVSVLEKSNYYYALLNERDLLSDC